MPVVQMNRLEAAVLDLNADDGGGLQKQKSSYHWDKVLLTFFHHFIFSRYKFNEIYTDRQIELLHFNFDVL